MEHPDPRLISESLEGELGPEEHREVESHLAACGPCSDLLEEFRDLRERARSLPDQIPPRDLWPGIARAIQEEAGQDPRDPDVIRLHPRVPAQEPEEKRTLRLSVPHAVAAGLALALFSAAIGAGLATSNDSPPLIRQAAESTAGPSAWVQLVEETIPDLTSTAMEVARLELSLANYEGEMDPLTVEVLTRNLDVIDRAIRESVAALRVDPGNSFLESNLERAVLAKGDYLREATSLVAPAT